MNSVSYLHLGIFYGALAVLYVSLVLIQIHYLERGKRLRSLYENQNFKFLSINLILKPATLFLGTWVVMLLFEVLISMLFLLGGFSVYLYYLFDSFENRKNFFTYLNTLILVYISSPVFIYALFVMLVWMPRVDINPILRYLQGLILIFLGSIFAAVYRGLFHFLNEGKVIDLITSFLFVMYSVFLLFSGGNLGLWFLSIVPLTAGILYLRYYIYQEKERSYVDYYITIILLGWASAFIPENIFDVVKGLAALNTTLSLILFPLILFSRKVRGSEIEKRYLWFYLLFFIWMIFAVSVIFPLYLPPLMI